MGVVRALPHFLHLLTTSVRPSQLAPLASAFLFEGRWLSVCHTEPAVPACLPAQQPEVPTSACPPQAILNQCSTGGGILPGAIPNQWSAGGGVCIPQLFLFQAARF